MKKGFEAILEPKPLFVFMLQYCNDKEEATKAAEMITNKFVARGKETYSGIFENVDLLKKYAEKL